MSTTAPMTTEDHVSTSSSPKTEKLSHGQILTVPSEGISNGNQDNADGNLIVAVGDEISPYGENWREALEKCMKRPTCSMSDKVFETNIIGTSSAQPKSSQESAAESQPSISEKNTFPNSSLPYGYIIQSALGTGTFGAVYRCIRSDGEKQFALKITKRRPAYHQQGRLEAKICQHIAQMTRTNPDSSSSADLSVTLSDTNSSSVLSLISDDGVEVASQLGLPDPSQITTLDDLLVSPGTQNRANKVSTGPVKGQLNTASTISSSAMRGSDTMASSSITDAPFLNLSAVDGGPHLVEFMESFDWRGHVCLVFELLQCSLFDILTQNQFRGLSLNAIQSTTRQLLLSLNALSEANVVHCDLKPENILYAHDSISKDASSLTAASAFLKRSPSQARLNTTKNSNGEAQSENDGSQNIQLENAQVKIIDFGSACMEGRTVYSYIQSRFYRSPEVLLGLPYTASIDMWSLACVCVEMFLGLPIFPGVNNHNQVSRIVTLLGMPPTFMVEAKFGLRYFTIDEAATAATSSAGSARVGTPRSRGSRIRYRLMTPEEFAVESNSPVPVVKKYLRYDTLNDIILRHPYPANMTNEQREQEYRHRECFLDFLTGIFAINPFERWTPRQAFQHPFIQGTHFTSPFTPPKDPKTIERRNQLIASLSGTHLSSTSSSLASSSLQFESGSPKGYGVSNNFLGAQSPPSSRFHRNRTTSYYPPNNSSSAANLFERSAAAGTSSSSNVMGLSAPSNFSSTFERTQRNIQIPVRQSALESALTQPVSQSGLLASSSTDRTVSGENGLSRELSGCDSLDLGFMEGRMSSSGFLATSLSSTEHTLSPDPEREVSTDTTSIGVMPIPGALRSPIGSPGPYVGSYRQEDSHHTGGLFTPATYGGRSEWGPGSHPIVVDFGVAMKRPEMDEGRRFSSQYTNDTNNQHSLYGIAASPIIRQRINSHESSSETGNSSRTGRNLSLVQPETPERFSRGSTTEPSPSVINSVAVVPPKEKKPFFSSLTRLLGFSRRNTVAEPSAVEDITPKSDGVASLSIRTEPSASLFEDASDNELYADAASSALPLPSPKYSEIRSRGVSSVGFGISPSHVRGYPRSRSQTVSSSNTTTTTTIAVASTVDAAEVPIAGTPGGLHNDSHQQPTSVLSSASGSLGADWDPFFSGTN